jgi:hypothetical protein
MDNITIILVTSVLPSHPDTSTIDETIASIRYHFPKNEILMQIDGLRDEQLNRLEDYNLYKDKILWRCLHKYKNIYPLVFNSHQHQSGMMKSTLDLINTELILYVEGDAPLVTDESIDWEKCIEMIYSGKANTIRFHHEGIIPTEHNHLMLGIEDGFMKTTQWSQRPHLTTKLYYQDVVMPNCGKKTFIEDKYHGIIQEDYNIHGTIGWNKHRLWIYYPDDKNIKRSYTTDGRNGGLKYTSDDEVSL